MAYSSFTGGTDSDQSEVINIFSVASGHLYERLLRIMMLSLLKHTKVSAPLPRDGIRINNNIFYLLFISIFSLPLSFGS